jgi:hypothetical protein
MNIAGFDNEAVRPFSRCRQFRWHIVGKIAHLCQPERPGLHPLVCRQGENSGQTPPFQTSRRISRFTNDCRSSASSEQHALQRRTGSPCPLRLCSGMLRQLPHQDPQFARRALRTACVLTVCENRLNSPLDRVSLALVHPPENGKNEEIFGQLLDNLWKPVIIRDIGLFSVPAPPFRFAASGGVFLLDADP